jgi:uncharacterized protein HemY
MKVISQVKLMMKNENDINYLKKHWKKLPRNTRYKIRIIRLIWLNTLFI